MKRVAFFLALPFALAALYLAIAFLLSIIPVAARPESGPFTLVYLRSTGVHTEFILPGRCSA